MFNNIVLYKVSDTKKLSLKFFYLRSRILLNFKVFLGEKYTLLDYFTQVY